MVHKRLGPLVRSARERDEHTPRFLEVALERVESAGASTKRTRTSRRPYPFGETGPKPNRRSAGFPQFDVDRIDVPSVPHPPSRKISGNNDALDELELTSELVSSSRWRRQ